MLLKHEAIIEKVVFIVLGKNPTRIKSHIGKYPIRKKSLEDKIPEDKITRGQNPM